MESERKTAELRLPLFLQMAWVACGAGGSAPLPDPRRWLLQGAPWRSRRCHFSWVFSRQLSEGDGAGEIFPFCGRATRSRDPAESWEIGGGDFQVWPQAWQSLIFSGFSLLGSLETSYASLCPFNSVGWGLGVGEKSGWCKSDAGNPWAFRFPRICKPHFQHLCRALSIKRPLGPWWHLPWGSEANVVYSLV